MSSLRVAAVQMEVVDGQPDTNVERASANIRRTAADVILLPELWTTGYAWETWDSTARENTPAVVDRLQDLSDQTGSAIGGSLISLSEEGRLVNRFWLNRPRQTPLTYDKAHLFKPLSEDQYLAAGQGTVAAQLSDWIAGLSICYDLRFPDMFAKYALGGAELILCSSEWPEERAHLLRLFARARAAENQCYLVLCNRVGTSRDGMKFGGGSAIIGPDGCVLAEAADAVATVEGVLARQAVQDLRSRLPVLQERVSGIDGWPSQPG